MIRRIKIFIIGFVLLTIGYQTEAEILKMKPLKIQKPVEKIVEKVHCTVYHAVPEQCNSDVQHTAFMFKLDLLNPYKHKIIAVSRDLLKNFPGGSKVKITGTCYDGIYVVNDKMNKRWTKRIDILINTDMAIGSWKDVKMEKINER